MKLIIIIWYSKKTYHWTLLLRYSDESDYFATVDRYDYIVNGTAMAEIHKYMEVEHTFAEYTEVNFSLVIVLITRLANLTEF